ncbi:ketosteroid isomerase-like protein [Streptomyces phaeogriseichromatogenes]|nr:ketosteroid isomerase-like protein [Streptomyces murinus]
MSNQTETVTESPADVVRGLYEALGRGDVPGVLAKLAPEVTTSRPSSPTVACTRAGRCSCSRSWAR